MRGLKRKHEMLEDYESMCGDDERIMVANVAIKMEPACPVCISERISKSTCTLDTVDNGIVKTCNKSTKASQRDTIRNEEKRNGKSRGIRSALKRKHSIEDSYPVCKKERNSVHTGPNQDKENSESRGSKSALKRKHTAEDSCLVCIKEKNSIDEDYEIVTETSSSYAYRKDGNKGCRGRPTPVEKGWC